MANEYATETDFSLLGLPNEALYNVDTFVIDAALAAASRTVDSYLAKRYPVPLATWGDDITRIVVDLAQYDILARRGFRPGSGADEIVVKRREDAIEWLKLVSKKVVEPTNITEAAPEIASPLASTAPPTNWRFNTRSNRGEGGCCGGSW